MKNNESESGDELANLDRHKYEDLSYRLNRIVYIPLPNRIKYLSFVMFGIASLYPLLVILPDYIKEVYFSQGVASSAPNLLNFTLIGFVLATVGFIGFCLSIYLRKIWWEKSEEQDMLQLIGIEDMSTIFALGNGGLFASVSLLIGVGAYFEIPIFREYFPELFQQTAMVSAQTLFVFAVIFGLLAYGLSHYSRFYLTRHGLMPETFKSKD